MLTTAMAAIDIALHDLVAKSLGVPVYQLLGGKQRDFVPCFVTTNARNQDDLLEEVKGLVADGWECIRTLVWGLWKPRGRSFRRASRLPSPPSGTRRCARRWGRDP